MRANAVEAFEDSGDAQCIALLRPYLQDADNRVRANAAKALWTLGSEDGREALLSMLRHDEEAMRLSAVWAIGELRFEGAMDVLIARAEEESSPAIRAKIAEVLAHVRPKGEATT